MGSIDVKSNQVYFHVHRATPYSTLGTIPFEVEKLNIGGAMDTASGVFRAPSNGSYHFTFTGRQSANLTYVDITQNGKTVGRTAAGGLEISSLSLAATLELMEGDLVALKLTTGAIDDNPTGNNHFTGMLLKTLLTV